jgi:hypothetical protein
MDGIIKYRKYKRRDYAKMHSLMEIGNYRYLLSSGMTSLFLKRRLIHHKPQRPTKV